MSDAPTAEDSAEPQASGGLYTTSDLKSLFGVNAATLWRWRRANLIPAPLRIGRRVYWKSATVWEHLERLDREAQAAARDGRVQAGMTHAASGLSAPCPASAPQSRTAKESLG